MYWRSQINATLLLAFGCPLPLHPKVNSINTYLKPGIKHGKELATLRHITVAHDGTSSSASPNFALYLVTWPSLNSTEYVFSGRGDVLALWNMENIAVMECSFAVDINKPPLFVYIATDNYLSNWTVEYFQK